MMQMNRIGQRPATRHVLAGGVAALALMVAAPVLAQPQPQGQQPRQQQQTQQQPQQTQGQQGQAQQGQLAPSQQAGSQQPVVMGQLRTAEQSLRQAQQQLSGNQEPNIPQARTAVSAGMSVIGRVPNELQRRDEFRTAREQLTEANEALQGQQPNARRAAQQIGEAADALAALGRQMGGMAEGQSQTGQRSAAAGTNAGAAAGAAGTGAQIAVQQPAPQVTVQQPQPQVTVQQPAPQVTVQQPQPQVTVQQPAPQVTVQQPQPQVTVQQPRPEVTVRQAEPQVTVRQAEPQVTVQRQGQPQVTVQRQGEAQVQVQREGQPQVTVQRQGEAQVRTEQQAQQGQQARPGADQRTGVTAPPAPAQSAGSQPQTAAMPRPAGVPLASVQNLIGANVYGANGRESGEIRNLLIDRDGQVRAAVVEWGGFLGIGEKEALVPIERLQIGAAGNDRVVMNMTRQELEGLPRYERNRIADYGRERGWGEGLRLYR